MCCFSDSGNNFYSVQKFWKVNNNINKRRKYNDLKAQHSLHYCLHIVIILLKLFPSVCVCVLCTYTYIYICIVFICVCVYMCVYIYIYTYMIAAMKLKDAYFLEGKL